ncbi:hypothetical protein Ocin01_13840 [Orchesella cincta]|uniref:Uncharacterized protein n=1 Tax=Orchesella cincta TaxID=48709 RepID=A0A1D2MIW1_ORCCI|nr:hypothetical protein Ocin01_13840 [Orchesella cincta]
MYQGISTGSCTNLPSYARNCTSSLKTTGCVAVYEGENCHNNFGHVFTSDKSDITSFLSPTKITQIASFRDCTALERDPHVNVDFTLYDYPETLTFRNVCSCTNLPKPPRHPHSNIGIIHVYGKCVIHFSDENCNGLSSFKGLWGETGQYDDDEFFRSFAPCNLPRHCVSMNSVLTKLEPLNDLIDLQNFTNAITIAATETFYNNGGAILEEDYSVEKDVEESFQFGFAKEFSQMNSLSFDVGVNIGGKASFFKKLLSVFGELKAGLSGKYQTNSSSTETKEYGLKRTTKFKVKKRVIIPPCTEYKIGSSVSVATDVVINYRVEYKITGIVQPDIKMKTKEIRQHFPGLKYIRDVDEFTILAQTTAQMETTFGLETFTDAKGTIITPCVRAKKALLCKPSDKTLNQP